MAHFEFWAYRNGVPYAALPIPRSCTPKIKFNGAAEVMRTIDLEIDGSHSFNWLTDTVQAKMVSDASEIMLGRFVITTHPTDVYGAHRSQSLTGYDYGYIVRNMSTLEHGITIPSGTQITAELQTQLIACGLTDMMITQNLGETLTDMTYQIGNNRYTIISDLLALINYRPLWFNGIGAAICEPWEPATADNVQHNYKRGPQSIMLPDMSIDDDIFDASNVFVSIVNNADLATDMVATSVNTEISSPLSVQNRGRRIVDVETLKSIANQTALQARADTRKLQSMMSSRIYEFDTGAFDETEHGLNDCIAIERDNIGLLEEQSWSVDCKAGGKMSHTAKAVYYLA